MIHPKRGWSTSICFVVAWTVIAQRDSTSSTMFIYAEALGPGGAASINVERELWDHDRWSATVRAGFSTHHLKDFTRTFNPDLILPLGVLVQYGGAFAVEIGGGPTITAMVEPDPWTFAPQRVWALNAFVSAGVRYWRRGHWPFARVAFTPLLEHRTGWRSWGAVSIGYAF